MKPYSRYSHFRRVWLVPSLLAITTMVGLLSTLLGDHLIWKGLGWACLIAPVATAAWFALRRRPA